jgi:hypothetical protein
MQRIVSQPPKIGQMLMFHTPKIKKKLTTDTGIVQNYLIQRVYNIILCASSSRGLILHTQEKKASYRMNTLKLGRRACHSRNVIILFQH